MMFECNQTNKTPIVDEVNPLAIVSFTYVQVSKFEIFVEYDQLYC
jgi:hypothetical protein